MTKEQLLKAQKEKALVYIIRNMTEWDPFNLDRSIFGNSIDSVTDQGGVTMVISKGPSCCGYHASAYFGTQVYATKEEAISSLLKNLEKYKQEIEAAIESFKEKMAG